MILKITVFNKPLAKGRTLASEMLRFQYETCKPYKPYGHPDHPFPQKLAYKPYGHPDHPFPIGGTPSAPSVKFKPKEKNPSRNAADFLEHNRWRLPGFDIQRGYDIAFVQVEKDDADDLLAALETAGFEFDAVEDN